MISLILFVWSTCYIVQSPWVLAHDLWLEDMFDDLVTEFDVHLFDGQFRSPVRTKSADSVLGLSGSAQLVLVTYSGK